MGCKPGSSSSSCRFARLPKAIKIAGATINDIGCSPTDCIEDIEHQANSSYEKSLAEDGCSAERGAYDTFQDTYSCLNSINTNRRDLQRAGMAASAIRVLNTICFFYNFGIDGKMFKSAGENRGRYLKGGWEIVELVVPGELINGYTNDGSWNPGPLAGAFNMLSAFQSGQTLPL